MNTNVVIHKKAGQEIPRGYLQEAVKQCGGCFGIAVQDMDGTEPVLDIITDAPGLGLDKLVETLGHFKDQQLILVLGNAAGEFNKTDDVMPFSFQQASEDGDAVNILAAAFDGDFPNYTKVGEGHSETFNLWENFIFPTLLEKHAVAEDIDDFYKKLGSSHFEQSVMNTVSHRAVAMFLPLTGDPIVFGRNELGGAFDWGATSNRFGWGDPTMLDKAKEVVTKGRSRLASIVGGDKVTASPPASTSQTSIKTDDKGVHHVTGAGKTDTTAKDVTVMKPPEKLQGNARNAWIRLFTNTPEGPMPEGHHLSTFTVAVPNNLLSFAKRDVSTKDDIRKLAGEVKKAKGSSSATPASTEKTTAAPAATSSKPAEPEHEPVDWLPTLTADDKKGAVQIVTAWTTRTEKHPSALDIQKIVAKWPKFSTVMGIKFADMFRWTVLDAKNLGKAHPDALALAFIEMQQYALAHGGLEVAEPVQDPAKVTPPAPPATAPAAAPAGDGGTPPKKKSRLAAITGQAA